MCQLCSFVICYYSPTLISNQWMGLQIYKIKICSVIFIMVGSSMFVYFKKVRYEMAVLSTWMMGEYDYKIVRK